MRYHGPHGLVWHYSPPCTAELLPLETTLALPVWHAHEQGAGKGAAYQGLYRWCARQTIHVEGITDEAGEPIVWRDLDPWEREDLLLQAFAPGEIHTYALHMRDAVALPDDMVQGIEQILYVQTTGGCECLECTERGTNRIPAACRYHGVPDGAAMYVNRHVHIREEPMLLLPFEYYQIKCAISRGIGRGMEDRSPTTGKPSPHDRATTDRLLKQHGIRV